MAQLSAAGQRLPARVSQAEPPQRSSQKVLSEASGGSGVRLSTSYDRARTTTGEGELRLRFEDPPTPSPFVADREARVASASHFREQQKPLARVPAPQSVEAHRHQNSVDRLPGRFEDQRPSLDTSACLDQRASGAIIFKGGAGQTCAGGPRTPTRPRPDDKEDGKFAVALERRAVRLEGIITSYLTNRDKPPFTRRELINVFREVINDLRLSKELIMQGEQQQQQASTPRHHLEGQLQLLEAKKRLESKVHQLQAQFERNQKEGALHRHRTSEELRQLAAHNQ